MIEVKIHNAIDNEDNRWWYEWLGMSGVFSLEYVQGLFAANPSENAYKFDIHCQGGSVEEGLAIYDYLRTSGKDIHMNIEGSCHSMATVLLLAAPLENRTANRHSVALIHKVSGGAYGTTDDVEAAASDMRLLQDKILDIYAERTILSRARLAHIMDEQKEHTADELLEWGFIGSINAYANNLGKQVRTNYNSSMAKNIKDILADIGAKLNKALGGKVNYAFTDAEGQTLFTTDNDTDTIAVGMSAEGDGVHTLTDGRIVTIEGGVITNIAEPSAEPSAEPTAEPTAEPAAEPAAEPSAEPAAEPSAEPAAEPAAPADPSEAENLRNELEDVRAQLAAAQADAENLRGLLAEANDAIREARAAIRSDYKVGQRIGSGAQADKVTNDREDEKKAVREALEAQKKARK